jgi:hypothetical protein
MILLLGADQPTKIASYVKPGGDPHTESTYSMLMLGVHGIIRRSKGNRSSTVPAVLAQREAGDTLTEGHDVEEGGSDDSDDAQRTGLFESLMAEMDEGVDAEAEALPRKGPFETEPEPELESQRLGKLPEGIAEGLDHEIEEGPDDSLGDLDTLFSTAPSV